MSDPMATPPVAPPPAAPAPAAPGFMASMSQTDMLIAAGAALIILTDLYSIFIAYGVSNVVWAAAAASLIIVLMRARLPASAGLDYRMILVLLGSIVVLLALRQVLVDVKFIATPPAGLSVERLLGMVGYYGGVVLMGLGVWQLWNRRKA